VVSESRFQVTDDESRAPSCCEGEDSDGARGVVVVLPSMSLIVVVIKKVPVEAYV